MITVLSKFLMSIHPTRSLPSQVPSEQGLRTRPQNNIRKPKQRTDGTVAYLANAENSEPTDYRVAMQNQNWKQAMEEEYGALMKNDT
jgi:hypothetical protein